MIHSRRHVLFAATAVPLLAVAGAGVALARGAQVDISGTAVNHVAVATETTPKTFTGNTWQTVASTTLESVAPDRILVRFSAESACFGGSGYCAARILVDDVEALPAAGLDFAFDSTANNTSTVKSTEARSIERVIENTGMSEPVPVSVQVRMVGSGGAPVKQRLDDWTLSAWSITEAQP